MILFFQSYLTLLLRKKLFALKFSPRAGVSRSPAIYMINHNNDILPGKADQPGSARGAQTGQYQGKRGTGVNTAQLLFVGMIAVLGEQVNAEDNLLELALDCTQSSSIKRLEKETMEWNQLGSYGYFLVRTAAPIWHTLSFAMICAGAITAVSLVSWVARIGMRSCKTGYNKSKC